MKWIRWMIHVAPEAIRLGKDVFQAAQGDHSEAVRNIRDLRAEIHERQAARDAAAAKLGS